MDNTGKSDALHAGAVALEKSVGRYYPEKDPLVAEMLEEWRKLKFGLLMHWAPSSQWGIVESWSLCSEDEEWCRRNLDDYAEYMHRYENLKTTFNPVRFDPAKWASAAKAAGMKYVVFTTKHHDGFCMYDSRFTDYKITDAGCPFHSDPRADVAGEVFREFRRKGFWIGAYYSKPDWHSEYFWWRRYATPDRNANYDIHKYPERWKKFVEFTHNQIDELMTNYGRIDILWLDGCWVRSYTEEELEEERKKASFNTCRIQNQDIDSASIVRNSRKKQPGLIVVDRVVPGPYQNYLTPENQIPRETLPYPWETCMPMTPSWSYEPGLVYKSARTLIHVLVDVVAKGGNLLLNVAPTPEGDYEDAAYERLNEIGAWMAVNGEAIYESRPVYPYREGNICYTQSGDGTVYALYLVPDGERSFPKNVRLSNFIPRPGAKIRILGTDADVRWKTVVNGCEIEIPETLGLTNPHAWTMKIG